MNVKEFNTAWLASLVRLQKLGIKQEDVEVVIEANDDGILEVAHVDLEEPCDDNPEYQEHVRSGGEREYSLVIEGV